MLLKLLSLVVKCNLCMTSCVLVAFRPPPGPWLLGVEDMGLLAFLRDLDEERHERGGGALILSLWECLERRDSGECGGLGLFLVDAGRGSDTTMSAPVLSELLSELMRQEGFL